MHSVDTGRDVPLIPVAYASVLANRMRRHGIGPALLLEGTNVPECALGDPQASLTIAQTERVIERTLAILRRPVPGFEFGLELDLAAHGLIGFAMLETHNVRSMLRRVTEYLRIRLPLMSVLTEYDGDDILLRFADPLLKSLAARRFVADAYLGGTYNLVAPFCQRIELCIAGDETHAGHLRRRVRCPVSAGHANDHARLYFRDPDATLPALQATHALADRVARESLGREEQGLAETLVLRVRDCIMRDPARNASLETVARQLGISTRSLRRHLEKGRASFSEIRNRIRQQFATRYLQNSTLPLEAIAERLGYRDPASFTRAFREWTGMSPGQFRRGGGNRDG